MTYIGFDHHKKWTQAAAIDDQAKIIQRRRDTLACLREKSRKGFMMLRFFERPSNQSLLPGKERRYSRCPYRLTESKKPLFSS